MTSKNYSVAITSNIKNSGSVFKRVYQLTIHDNLEDNTFIASFKSVDHTPSRLIRGGSEQSHFKNQPIKMDIFQINKCIAKLALTFDTSLTLTKEQSLVNIKADLIKMSNKTVEVLEIN